MIVTSYGVEERDFTDLTHAIGFCEDNVWKSTRQRSRLIFDSNVAKFIRKEGPKYKIVSDCELQNPVFGKVSRSVYLASAKKKSREIVCIQIHYNDRE